MVIREIFVNALLPMTICVVLPVLIVWIVVRARVKRDDMKTQILLESLRSNKDINAEKIAEAMTKPVKTPFERQMTRLLWAGIWTFIGIAFIVYWIIEAAQGEGLDELEVLFLGIICTGIGISFLTVYFVAQKQLDKENKDSQDYTESVNITD